ncbi:LPS-assembly protein LptD [Pelagibacterium limicola]|uniref:LPS-assembly protein LptD n=1 Tax=Pelagibacterium limicola TaxID=2791022 RepID=UPI0018AF608F|nr:LPS assembly protein LptD [Pelagibacterium limicola]
MGGTSRRHAALRATRTVALAVALACAPALPVSAQQILPPDFFSRIPTEVAGRLSLEADVMVFDQRSDAVIAEGNVGIRYAGFRVTADRAIYYQRSGRVELVGNVAFIDPLGHEYIAERVELEDGFRRGFLEALTVAQPDGTWLSAAETSFDQGVERIYIDGTYAPCGSCVDENGNTIGWKVRAARVVTDEQERVVYFEQPSLELLGVSVLHLPWLTMPMDEDVEFPVASFDNRYGIGLHLPLFNYRISGGTLLLMPSLYSRQGFMLGAQWRQTVGDLTYTVAGSGIYQLDPGAYNGLANRPFRGHLQTTGKFTPTVEWTMGWSYTVATDPSYLRDYRIERRIIRNEVYATHLNETTFADVRFQQFVPQTVPGNGESAASHQARFDNAVERQALTHPNARVEHVQDLGDDNDRFEFSARLLGLTRLQDHQSRIFGGQRYVHGYEGQSAHLMLQGAWTNQYIVPGGLEVSPYLGLRGDAAGYDGSSALASAPAAQTLLSATPIAALDVRYPLAVRATGATTIIAPIVQLVYRDGPPVPGITNNDSQNVDLDTANIFSFNRFSGADRQETGLRANVGVTLDTSFDDGGWLSASIGQSHHLAGPNGYATADGSTGGVGTSLESASSYIVAGLEAGFGELFSGGGRLQVDPATGAIPAANMRATIAHEGYAVSGTYAWADVNPALGITQERHDVGADVTIPIADYWRVRFGTSYDLVANQLLTTKGALEYDDRYLAFGVGTRLGGPVSNWGNDFRVEFSLRLRAAGNREVVGLGYSWDN